jgi:hypothetical protein
MPTPSTQALPSDSASLLAVAAVAEVGVVFGVGVGVGVGVGIGVVPAGADVVVAAGVADGLSVDSGLSLLALSLALSLALALALTGNWISEPLLEETSILTLPSVEPLLAELSAADKTAALWSTTIAMIRDTFIAPAEFAAWCCSCS